MSDELITFLTAMTPVGELRASIPLGLIKFDLSWPLVLALSIAGNLVPVPFILVGLNRLGRWLESFPNPAGAFLRWRSRQVQQQFGPLVRRYDALAVALLVAIPFPLTGAWTGTLVVWALRVRLRRAIPAIVVGVCIAGGLITGLALAGVEAFRSIS